MEPSNDHERVIVSFVDEAFRKEPANRHPSSVLDIAASLDFVLSPSRKADYWYATFGGGSISRLVQRIQGSLQTEEYLAAHPLQGLGNTKVVGGTSCDWAARSRPRPDRPRQCNCAGDESSGPAP